MFLPGFVTPRPGRRTALVALALVLVVAMLAAPGRAIASTTQEAMFQDDPALLANPSGTLSKLRLLGVDRVRVAIRWLTIAPASGSRRRPHGFNASDPAAYPARNWILLDTIVSDAQQDGLATNFNVVGGAPLWATGPGAPAGKHTNWDPSPRELAAFVRALGTRYSGTYTPAGSSSPLPRVSFWSIWNEPDYGPSLAPQGVPGHLSIENSPRMYRNLFDASWSALHATGHGADKILFGEVAPRGLTTWGVFSGMKPLIFLRALYCSDSRYRELRGAAAAARGCPTTASRSARFREANPGLFEASGFADHPYMRWYRPNREAHPDPDYSSLGELGGLARALDRLQRVYGSHTRFPIYDTEFGYITSPPKHTPDPSSKPGAPILYISPSTAAYYLNWAEYLSWRNPRVQSFMQYLLADPLPARKANDYGSFASGLLSFGSLRPKATYYAWRLPLYLPHTTARSGQRLEVWGCVRPAHFATIDPGGGPQSVEIQFEPSSSGTFTTVATVPITDPHGYFDTHVAFPGSGTVRLRWTYPAGDLLLAPGYPTHSRNVQITVH